MMFPDHLGNWLEFGHTLLTFSNFGVVFTCANEATLGVPAIILSVHGRTSFTIGMMIYPDQITVLGFQIAT